MSEQAIPAKYARLLLKVAAENGHKVDQIVEEIGFSFNPMDLSPDQQLEQDISAQDFSRLYSRVSDLLKDECFGITRTKVPMGTFRMFCYSVIHSPSLRIALSRSVDFYAMLYEAKGLNVSKAAPYYLSADGEYATLVHRTFRVEPSHDMDLQKQLTIINYMSMWHRFICWLIGTFIPIKEVKVTGPEILSNSGYRFYFDCPIHFQQTENAFTFKSHFLDAPLVHTEESLHQFLKTAPLELFTIVNEDESVIKKIRSLIGSNFTRKIPGFDEVAEMLNISSRTLRRRLEKEGTSYQRVKDDCRRDAAIDYLTRSDMSINSVASLMGFDEPSAFHRSFKKWTGITPGEFRKRNSVKETEAAVEE
ncbi:AraC family transcriptional regulator [Endozoicomonas numazuensis]|uniref:HTH araC/xylS-type domain-containing protein n=1 Tax=Endozoicomonas numazuensis TaxID=1137799 RepID=A0A081NMT5_9GAMM|nr:AraC family transcriptional regulator [Endozoicomonas numazuensis]KEQ19758.1 hypothetical protein GZ78_07785 [Endozoicomonas numazuensis]